MSVPVINSNTSETNMARRYSGKHGKAGSKKPSKDKVISWMNFSKEEIEQLVIKVAKTGKHPSQIGMVLRDSYGIPDVEKTTGKKITKILAEHKLSAELPEDLLHLLKKQINLQKHLGKNKKDMPVKRGLMITKSKIKRLVDYYKETGKLPKNWTYSEEQVKLIVG